MAEAHPDQPAQPQGERPKFDPSAAHQQRPKLRKVRGFPVPAQSPDGQQQTFLGLADAQQISSKVVATSPAVQEILPLMDGQRDLDQIVAQVGKGLTRDILEQLVAQLDDAALIYGPTFDGLLQKMREDFDSSSVLPPASTAQIADQLVMSELGQEATDEQKAEHGPRKLRELFDQWIAQVMEKTQQAPLESLPRAIVTPHIDYPRGWVNYAAVWGSLRGLDRPDRVVILGTNHFGESTGVCGCDKGFESPLGVCDADEELIEKLRARLGEEDSEKLFANRYDHEREHSIELQIPWLQHCLADGESGDHPRVFAALVHDPAINNGESYDGSGLALEPFVDALRDVLAELPGRTLVIGSADLSHVGPAFGDREQLVTEERQPSEFCQKVREHDQEMLKLVIEGKVTDLISSMAWQSNPTRWCSTGNLVATIRVVEPETIRLLNYAAAIDQQGAAMVSTAALVMN